MGKVSGSWLCLRQPGYLSESFLTSEPWLGAPTILGVCLSRNGLFSFWAALCDARLSCIPQDHVLANRQKVLPTARCEGSSHDCHWFEQAVVALRLFSTSSLRQNVPPRAFLPLGLAFTQRSFGPQPHPLSGQPSLAVARQGMLVGRALNQKTRLRQTSTTPGSPTIVAFPHDRVR